MKKLLWLMLIICILFSSCKKPENVTPVIDPLPTENNADDKYELVALSSDKQGIDKTSVFQLTSKVEIDDSFIKQNLEIIPQQEYKIEKFSGTVHNIIPSAELQNDKVYQVKLNDKEYNYSWAFKQRKNLKWKVHFQQTIAVMCRQIPELKCILL